MQFNRQYIIAQYIVDFYCSRARLVIELDGSQHQEPFAREYDAARTEYLNALGLKVIRFSNAEVDRAFYEVCRTIDAEVNNRLDCISLRRE